MLMIRPIQSGLPKCITNYTRNSLVTAAFRRLPPVSLLQSARLTASSPFCNSKIATFGHSLSIKAPKFRCYSTPVGKIEKPTYQLSFTCKACQNRSSHLVSKQAYHNGTVLIQCPSCLNRHLIADHLNVFGQGKKTLEDILREKGDGETVKMKTVDLSKIGDIEWEGPNEPPEQSDVKQIE